MLAGVDRAAFAVALATRLRKSGVAVGTTATQAFARALGLWEPRSMGMLYWMARVTLVQRWADLETFDAVFLAVFSGVGLALDPAARRGSDPTGAAGRGSYRSVPGAAALEVAGRASRGPPFRHPWRPPTRTRLRSTCPSRSPAGSAP